MPIVSHHYRFVIGVDTHARKHVYAVITATGEHVATEAFPTSPAGIKRALTWVDRRTGGERRALWVIEGAASYGAILAGNVASRGHTVAEAPRMNPRARHGIGKSDPLDAGRIANATLALDTDRLRTPRLDNGIRQALRTLTTTRDALTGERTRAINALTALVRVNDLGIDARKPLSVTQIENIARWRSRDEELSLTVARGEATRLAKRITSLDEEINDNQSRITQLVEASPAAPLLDKPGIGPVTAATCLAAYSHDGRLRSEAAFAALAGVNPIPASSGNTVRHRLNRGGDRSLNKALHMIALTRMYRDPETIAYVKRRTADGRTTREIRRTLKRYIARQIYRTINTTKQTAIAT